LAFPQRNKTSDNRSGIDRRKEFKVYVSLESKVFGIGVESYTVGSSEFTINYAARHGIISLMDNGHYHPTEVVSDKISSMLLFNDRIALHLTRPVRWDSDHVIRLDDETKEICREIVRNHALKRVFIATDYFDASINRVAAMAIGVRNLQKALLSALLEPNGELIQLQNDANFTKLLAMQERIKMMPFGDVWDEYCTLCNVPKEEDYIAELDRYDKEVVLKR